MNIFPFFFKNKNNFVKKKWKKKNINIFFKTIFSLLFFPLFNRLRSRSLTELTRQITPPTQNGHAPPITKSWKSYQSVNPNHVLTWWVFPCWVKLSRRFHSWWCPSVNSFKFQPCDHTPPGIRILYDFSQGPLNRVDPI